MNNGNINKQETLNFSVGNIAIFVRIVLERKLKEFENFVYAQNGVPNITWSIWSPLLDIAMNRFYDDFLEELYAVKYESSCEKTKDDIKVLNHLYDIKKNALYNSKEKMKHVVNYLQNLSETQEQKERKPKAIVRALNATYSQLYQDDSAIMDLLEEYFNEETEVILDEKNLIQVAQYTMNKMFASFTFAKNYIKTWGFHNHAMIAKTANKLLQKYSNNEQLYNELYELIKTVSCSFVYSSWHKQFAFLDNALAKHTDSVLHFTADYMGYSEWIKIPIEDYPKCDAFIKKYIEIKGANDEKLSRSKFKSI